MSLSDLWINVQAIMPLAALMAWTCLLLLVDLFIPKERKGWTAVLAAVGLVAAFVLLLAQPAVESSALNGMVSVDGFARFMQGFFLLSGLAGIFLAYDYLKRMGLHHGEYYTLLLFSIGGMMSMSMVSDLIMVFLSLEWLSIPLYVLSGFASPKKASEESALKYFLLGAYAGGFVLYGTALIFGATGTTNLDGIVSAVQAGQGAANGGVNLAMLAIGGALILIGLGFKVSVVPFHMWTPDVYQGAPTSVTGFMAVTAKAAGFAALLRIFTLAFPAVAADLTPVLWVLAALTMFLGNVVALAQSNIKRMLAYSAIAHAGYILMALVPYGQPAVATESIASGVFYQLAYGVTTFGAWAVVIALEKTNDLGTNLEDYAGLGRKYPALAACMTIFMLSFTGVPPTLGFLGKLYLFRTAIEGGMVGLAIIGVLTSLVSAYYYLRVVIIMYFRDGDPSIRSEGWLNLTVAASAVAVVVFSLFSSPLFEWAAGAIVK
jgi:NADH-quinone oxidoreductase subunit N